MVEEKIKKKLTLTISNKKNFTTPSYTPSSNKKSVVIEKKISRKRNEKRFYDQGNKLTKSTSKFFDNSLNLEEYGSGSTDSSNQEILYSCNLSATDIAV